MSDSLILPTNVPDGDHLIIELHPNFLGFACRQRNAEYIQPLKLEYIQPGPGNSMDMEALKLWLKRYQSIWNRSFDTVNIAVHIPHLTIVPDPSLGEQTLIALDNLPESYQWLQTFLQKDFYWSFAIDKQLADLLKNYFFGASIVPGTHGWMQFIQDKFETEKEFLSAIVYHDKVHISYWKEGRCLFYNQYSYNAKEDLLYYVLLTYKMFELDPGSFPLHLSGFIEEKSPLFEAMYMFIRNIQMAEFKANVTTEDLEEAKCQPHYLINLLSLHS